MKKILLIILLNLLTIFAFAQETIVDTAELYVEALISETYSMVEEMESDIETLAGVFIAFTNKKITHDEFMSLMLNYLDYLSAKSQRYYTFVYNLQTSLNREIIKIKSLLTSD